MRVKEILAEDFVNFKHPAMFIASAMCDWKCCREAGIEDVCQNKMLADSNTIDITDEAIYSIFISNNITSAVVIGGLEPMLQINEVVSLIDYFRSHDTDCPFVIYTGYNELEIEDEMQRIAKFSNIIVKFGRYIPNSKSRFDPIIGIDLASDNQYAKQISPPTKGGSSENT